MIKRTRTSRKGQSAIEYLMTYGWMLLVVAIVGGAIFVTVQGQCVQDATGFTGESVAVDSLEVSDDALQLQVSNQEAESVEVTSIDLGDGEASTWEDNEGNTISDTNPLVLNPGDSDIISTGEIVADDACNDFSVELVFDRGEFSDATSSGSISGNMAPSN